MEYNSFQHQDYTISGALHAQKCTHTWMTLHFFCIQNSKKKKKKKKKKKIDLPTLPISGLYVQNLCSFLIGYPI